MSKEDFRVWRLSKERTRVRVRVVVFHNSKGEEPDYFQRFGKHVGFEDMHAYTDIHYMMYA